MTFTQLHTFNMTHGPARRLQAIRVRVLSKTKTATRRSFSITGLRSQEDGRWNSKGKIPMTKRDILCYRYIYFICEMWRLVFALLALSVANKI